jgi:hypothetical protein
MVIFQDPSADISVSPAWSVANRRYPPGASEATINSGVCRARSR